ncbi:putative ACR, YkgG family [Geoglobus ahangari]|uniref:Putative ACR, YkgG family n=1 Tax=Geoglobus ahangari TaxID=113653 RepID=A0A0F7IG49_9EURY|nr:LUD domain-containing protein [Geoglobus ahangari]AKG92502.1 putative ACR, YkgG family [Geoglobus ahangari]
MRIAEVLRRNGADVLVVRDANEVLEKFRDAYVSHALSADEKTGVIFLGGVEDKRQSALAEYHVIVLRAEDIMEDVLSAYAHARARSNHVFATSSPSKTADIEGKLVFGMHGPRRVTVIIEVGE